jgi:hypothetical protein
MSSADIVSLSEAAAWIQRHGTGQRPHTSTLTRWIHRGVRGRRLPAVRAGGGRYAVHLADLAAFVERLNGDAPELPAVHAVAHELEMRQLDELLGRSPR